MRRQNRGFGGLNNSLSLDLDETKQTVDMDKVTDNRKVVVEDLLYIDDLEMLIYTTIAPKTSTIFVTHTKKSDKAPEQIKQGKSKLSA